MTTDAKFPSPSSSPFLSLSFFLSLFLVYMWVGVCVRKGDRELTFGYECGSVCVVFAVFFFFFSQNYSVELYYDLTCTVCCTVHEKISVVLFCIPCLYCAMLPVLFGSCIAMCY